MGPNRYPACVLFYFAIVVSFLAMGRVALRARDFARTRTASVGNPGRPKFVASQPNIPSSPTLAAERNLRPSSVTTPKVRTSGAAEPSPTLQPFAAPLPPRADRFAPAIFSVPITFEPAIDSPGQTVQFVGHGKGMTVLLESSGIEIAIGNAPGATASANSVKLRLLNAAASRRLSNAIVSAPERRRKRRPNTTPPPRTRRSPNRRNMPHRDTPGHRGQAPRAATRAAAARPASDQTDRPAGNSTGN